MSAVVAMNRDELEELRRKLLRDVGMTYEELRERANAYTLQPEERAAYETIRSIGYMIGA